MHRLILPLALAAFLFVGCGKQDGPQLPADNGPAKAPSAAATPATPAQPVASDPSCPADSAGGECC